MNTKLSLQEYLLAGIKKSYAVNNVENTISVCTINQTTRALTALTAVASGYGPNSIPNCITTTGGNSVFSRNRCILKERCFWNRLFNADNFFFWRKLLKNLFYIT
jgi:hypothetical protein